MAKPLLLDQFGNELTFQKRPPLDRQAEVGTIKPPWSDGSRGEITPEDLGVIMRGGSDLSRKMAFTTRLLDDDQVHTCMRNLSLAIGKAEWEFLPFDDSADAKKDAEEAMSMFNSLRYLRRLIRHLAYGELYPFVAPEIKWNENFNPVDFEIVEALRWTTDTRTNQLRVRTLRSPHLGEPIADRRGFIIHSSWIEPGKALDGGLWRKLAWPWLFKHAGWEYQMRFAEAFGNPYIIAFFKRAEEKAATLEAVLDMDANARGVFPEGTQVEIKEAQKYGSVHVSNTIIKLCDRATTKVVMGHTLNTDSESGSGTLAGGHAEQVSQENKEGVSEGISETIQRDLFVPWWGFRHGWSQVEKGELPVFKLKAKPPVDLKLKAETYRMLNVPLASAGKAIDPSQIEDDFAVRLVDRPKPAVQPPAADDDDNEEKDEENEEEREEAKARTRRLRAKAEPRIKTADDVTRVSTQLIRRAAQEFSDKILAVFEAAGSIEEGADAMWEAYTAFDNVKLASGLRDATVTAELTGRGDAKE